MSNKNYVDAYKSGQAKINGDWDTIVKDPKKNLYDKYSKPNEKKDVLVTDGIAYPELWFDQDVRPLFVLKEAYDSTDEHKPWDELKYFVRESKHEPINHRSKTWRKLCDWTRDIFRCKEKNADYYWDDEWLKHIAVINIKKYGGWNPSKNDDLKMHAEEHADLIYEQIELIKPTVIICGYTGWLLDIVWEKMGMDKIRNSESGRLHLVKNMDAVLIDFWHPSCPKYSKEWEEDMIAYHNGMLGGGIVPNQPPKVDDSENENKSKE